MQTRMIQLYEERFGAKPEAVLSLASDGSTRSYRRLVGADGTTIIGGIGPDHEENHAFLSFSASLRAAGLPVPEIYAADETAGVWLSEDLGDTTLFAELERRRDEAGGTFPDRMVDTYRTVLEWLPRFQIDGGGVVDYSVAYPRAAFDRQSVLWDLNYFKYHFLKLAHVPFHEAGLEQDFETLATFLLDGDNTHFLYRDFQSRNVMLRGDAPWFIDYQGGRRGALQYDVASLLYDAKADIPGPIRTALLEHYLDVLEARLPIDRDAFVERYRGFVLIRILQALGAYGYRGFFERKPGFLRSVPYAASNLAEIRQTGLPVALPEIETALGHIIDTWAVPSSQAASTANLTVRVRSFAFPAGYPTDTTGHGGGFVFDCRGLDNPGRQEKLRALTGLDDPVVEYLQRTPAVEIFWAHASALADGHVEEFLRRGFEMLTVSFGCTGGQHRSVYMAERMARHLRARYPGLEIELEHRESGSWPAGPKRTV